MKSNTNITLDSEILLEAKHQGFNVSRICNDALKSACEVSNLTKEDINNDISNLRLKIKLLTKHKEAKDAELEDKSHQAFQLNIFLKEVGMKILEHPSDMKKWAERTGKTIPELHKLKNECDLNERNENDM